ncbi:Imm50 family immunity protein [Streptomyces sp. NPDC101151]|uniref:Imm50 family immunity protein n=1 Tax=Streptomyces sp. NPDC101151 TaxID=3366115 RepID=UPI0038299E88
MTGIALRSDEFMAIFQITHQGLELSNAQLLSIGASSTEVALLAGSAGDVRKLMSDVSRIRIEVAADLESANAPTVGREDATGTPTIWVSEATANLWGRLAEYVIQASSPRELSLRTGYEQIDLRRAAARIADLTQLMLWTSVVINPEGITRIYQGAPPNLSGVRLREVVLGVEGPEMRVRLDLPAYPAQPPRKWAAQGFNTVQIEFAFGGLRSITLASVRM